MKVWLFDGRLTNDPKCYIMYTYTLTYTRRNEHETVYGRRKSASQTEKIIGQVQAIDRMIDEDIPCEDILAQINAAKSALHGCGKVVLEGHIQHCVRDGIEHGDADKTIADFTKAVERFANMG